jgi:hypothetical protein
MKSLKDFIDGNKDEFNNLSCSEIIHCSLDEFDDNEVEYLKINYRFDHDGICVYYVDRKSYNKKDEIWIENMNN